MTTKINFHADKVQEASQADAPMCHELTTIIRDSQLAGRCLIPVACSYTSAV